jgi:GTP-binding protein EngB required for normal cell division
LNRILKIDTGLVHREIKHVSLYLLYNNNTLLRFMSSAVDLYATHIETGAFAELTGRARAGRPEIAFIGRSNVGKSSLINMLTNQKGLALISKCARLPPCETKPYNGELAWEQWT